MLLGFAALAATLVYLPMPLNYYSIRRPPPKPQDNLPLTHFVFTDKSLLYNNSELLTDADDAFELFAKQNNRSWTGKAFRFMRLITSANKPFKNIVLIVMESFARNRCGILGGKKPWVRTSDSTVRRGHTPGTRVFLRAAHSFPFHPCCMVSPPSMV